MTVPKFSKRQKIKDIVFLQIASELSQLSTCDRKSVGAVITRQGRCVCWGFNGAPPGMPHCDENYHGHLWPGAKPNDLEALDRQIEAQGCRNVTHAEANALAFAARQGISTEGGTVYVTVSPCANCARLLVAAGVARVVYLEAYRDHTGIELLREAGVQVEWA